MILQKLSTGLLKRDWSSVLIEILIVVVGILVGLQVDGWNQARKDRIDETRFLERLHDDVTLADELSHRVRQRRLDRLEWTLSAADVLFNRNESHALTADECTAIVWSTAFNVTAPGLPSVDELVSTGRMGIIRNTELRTALVGLRQARAALDATIAEKSSSSNFRHLPGAFPELFSLEAGADGSTGEIQTINACDLASMRTHRAFLNQFSANADGYDAYVRDALRPWSQQMDKVHQLVDQALEIDHRDEHAE